MPFRWRRPMPPQPTAAYLMRSLISDSSARRCRAQGSASAPGRVPARRTRRRARGRTMGAVSEPVERADVVVIGGGVIGLSIAWRLASEGASVRVLERDRPGAEASGAAGGQLVPLAGPGMNPALLAHYLDAMRL